MKVVIYNENLNPDFWLGGNILKPEIRASLLKIAKTFYEDIELKVSIKDILFLGSSANYNWTPSSDVDLHLLLDFKELQMPKEYAKKFTNVLAKKWNGEHDIKVLKYNVEVYIQDVDEVNRSTGVYSILTNWWVKKAIPQDIVLDKNLIQQKYSTWVYRINKAVSDKNLEVLKNTMKDLVKTREAGLTKAGEYSTENVVFKILRQRGQIAKLKDSIQTTKSKELSLKDGYEATSFGPNAAATEGLPDLTYYNRENNKMRKM